MDKVYIMDKFTDFKNITLDTPEPLKTKNTYFTKTLYNLHPLNIQTGKCNVHSGLLCSENINFCDLIYKNDDNFLGWFESLENTLLNLIHSKCNLWFQTNINKHILQSNFTSPLKLCKNGKYSLVRVIIPDNINCYNKSGEPINISILNDNTQTFVPLLEISGVRFLSSKSFSCEITLKQIMVIPNTVDVPVVPVKELDIPKNDVVNIDMHIDNNEPFLINSRESILNKKWNKLRDELSKLKILLVELYKKEKKLREYCDKQIEKDIFDIFLEEQICLG